MTGLDRALMWLRSDEGLRLKPYLCSEGKRTIGYGHNLDASPLQYPDAQYRLKTQGHITINDAELQLHHDARQAEAVAMRLVAGYPFLSPTRQAVLVCMAFQLGPAGLASFRKTRRAIEAGDFETAANEMLASKWAAQTPARARRMAERMRTGKP